MLTATRFANLRAWASASLGLLSALAEALPAAETLEATWRAMEADLGPDAAEAILQARVQEMVRRLNGILGREFFPDGGYDAETVRRIASDVANLRRAFGLGAPALPKGKPPESWWWRELRDDGTPKFLVETEIIRRNEMEFPSRWILACDDWTFQVDETGGLVRAVRK
jgi:hypothetical protein